jgi:hypothetical protein
MERVEKQKKTKTKKKLTETNAQEPWMYGFDNYWSVVRNPRFSTIKKCNEKSKISLYDFNVYLNNLLAFRNDKWEASKYGKGLRLSDI